MTTNTNDEKILQRWKTRNQLSPHTYKNYKSVIKHYTKCTGMSLHELYLEAIEEEEQGIPRYRRSIKDHLLDYYNYLDTTNLTETTKSSHIKIVRSFYKHLDIDIPNIQNKYEDTPIVEHNSKNITKELIKTMLDTATIRDKAILTLAALTGQSPDEIQNKILQLPAPRLDIIIGYLTERQYGDNSKLRINGNNEPVFITKQGKPFSMTAVGALFTSLGKRCGFEQPENFNDDIRMLLTRTGGEHRVWRAYNFRKYFINTCRRYAGTTEGSEFTFTGLELADFWVGHKIKGSIKHYIQYNHDDVDYMQQQYLQVLPYLSLESEINELTTRDKREFLELKKQYDKLSEEMVLMKEYLESKAFVEKIEAEMKNEFNK